MNLLYKLSCWMFNMTFTAFVAATFLSGCDKKELFEAPPHATPKDQTPLPSTLSTLTLATELPYQSIRSLIQSQTPSQMNFSGNGHVACGQIPFINPGGIESHEKCLDVPYCDFRGCGLQRQCVHLPDTFRAPSIGTHERCADYDWSAVASRQGDAVVAKAGDYIHLEIPIKIAGKAGVGGDLAKLLSLSAKSFEAQLRPGVDVLLSLGQDWCPKLAIVPTNNWVSSAKVEAVGRNCLGFDLGALGKPEVCAGPVNIDLTSKANDAVAAQQSNLVAAANAAINCKSIRDSVAAQWRPIAIQLVPDNSTGKPLYLNISPKGFAFSGLKAADDSVNVALKVWAETKIDPIPVKSDPIPLPEVSPLDASESRLSVALPVRVPYSDIAATLAANFRGKDFSTDTSAGKVRVRIEDLEIYPTSNGLAIGVKIDAKLPGQFLNTKGWIYLIGQPKSDPTKSTIEIAKISYATVLDNKAWQVLVAVFDTQILKALQVNSRIDLKPAITQSTEQLMAQINGASMNGVKVKANLPTANLEAISIGADSILGFVTANMDFTLRPNLDDARQPDKL